MFALELFVVAALMAVNGFLALSELAVVSANRGKLKIRAEAGSSRAATALALANDPGRFLSTAQVGITLVGVLAGAFSGTTLGERLGGVFIEFGVPQSYAQSIGIAVVVVVITYLSVIVGELVPKQLALRDPERFAMAVAPVMMGASKLAGPVVAFFDWSGRMVLRVIGHHNRPETNVTDDDIRAVVAEAASAGVIEPEERRMISGVMRLADRRVRTIMTHRLDVDMVDIAAPLDEIRQRLRQSGHSRLPAYRKTVDNMLGIVQAKDVLDAYLSGDQVDIRALVKPAPVVPDTVDALDVLDVLKSATVQMALVHDEYGDFEGVVTTYDILQAIAGAFSSELEPAEQRVFRRADGSLLLAGDLPIDEAAEVLGIRVPADPEYQTLGGLILATAGEIPQLGDEVLVQGWRLEVVDLDGRRIDKVLADRVPARRHAA
jgi:putative hemolysin